MKWSNVKPKEVIKLIKDKAMPDHMYNVSMNKVKKIQTEQPPEWAKELIQKVDGISNKLDNLEVKVDNNTKMIQKNHSMIEKNHSMIKTAHPDLF